MSLRNSAKIEQGFELKPPACHSCVHFAIKRARNISQTYPRCMLGDFVTTPHSICDRWQSKQGEVIA